MTRGAENVIAKIAGGEKERKKRKWNSSTWPSLDRRTGLFIQSVSQCSDFETTTSLSLAENLRSDQRGSDRRRRARKARDCGEDCVPIFEDFSSLKEDC